MHLACAFLENALEFLDFVEFCLVVGLGLLLLELEGGGGQAVAGVEVVEDLQGDLLLGGGGGVAQLDGGGDVGEGGGVEVGGGFGGVGAAAAVEAVLEGLLEGVGARFVLFLLKLLLPAISALWGVAHGSNFFSVPIFTVFFSLFFHPPVFHPLAALLPACPRCQQPLFKQVHLLSPHPHKAPIQQHILRTLILSPPQLPSPCLPLPPPSLSLPPRLPHPLPSSRPQRRDGFVVATADWQFAGVRGGEVGRAGGLGEGEGEGGGWGGGDAVLEGGEDLLELADGVLGRALFGLHEDDGLVGVGGGGQGVAFAVEQFELLPRAHFPPHYTFK